MLTLGFVKPPGMSIGSCIDPVVSNNKKFQDLSFGMQGDDFSPYTHQ